MEGGDWSPETDKLPELKLDPKQAQGFISFFNSLPPDPKAVRFFDRKDYYTAHGQDASFIAKNYYRTTTALRKLGNGSKSLCSVSVNKNMFENVSRDLLLDRTDHIIEVYEGSGSNWKIAKYGTPGNIGCFEDILFANNDMQDSPVIVALSPSSRENQYTIGLGYLDMTKRIIGMAEFNDDCQFSNVESTLVAIGCKECVVPIGSDKSLETHLYDVLKKCDVLLTKRKKSEFKSRDLVQDLGRIIRGSIEPVRDLLSEFECALCALGSLLSYIDLLADESNYGNYTIMKYNLANYMRLDSAAVRALNVLESKTDANKNYSLFGLMNRTCTAGMGKRLLNRWLKQPLLVVNDINERLDLVQLFVENPEIRQGLRQHLKRVSDIERLTHSLRKATSLQPVVKLYQSCIRLPHIKGVLEHYEGKFSPLVRNKYLSLLDLFLDKEHLQMFFDLVTTAIDLDDPENGQYMISTSYDESLIVLKKELATVDHQLRNLHMQVADDLDLSYEKNLKMEKGTQFGHVFRITKKEEQKIRKKLTENFVILETRKDGVKFTNSKLKKLSVLYQKVFDQYTTCQKELILRVVDTASTFSEVFVDIVCILSELDVLLSFSDLAVSCPTPYTRPYITSSNEGDIILEGSRHPCVEAQDDVNFIPNDCSLIKGETWFQIITGPNMGGKSTFIRQVGVNVLMAQVGSFVPCDRASISIRDCIFARVGAGDCQLRGVSTFMQEMLETASILRGATANSLVIIDELGRGTSTYDGFGLAWAICEHLVDVIKAPTLFATHFHELTALAHGTINSQEKGGVSTRGVANYHVEAHIDPTNHKLTMLYKVEPGACDQSFGIHVAEFAKFPKSVVELAREKADELEDFNPSNPNNKEEGSKQKRICNVDDIAEGSARAHQFLQDFSMIPFDKMELKEALHKVKKIRVDLEKDAAIYPWLKQFF